MHSLFASASVLALVSGETSRTLFSTPTMYAAQQNFAYGAPVASNVRAVESTPHFVHAAPAFTVKRVQPAQSVAVYAAAAVLCGTLASLVATSRRPQAIAEPKVAMLFGSGRNAKAKPKARGRAPAKPKPKAKPQARRSSGRNAAEPKPEWSYFGIYQGPPGKEYPLQRFVQNFFTTENWVYQLIVTLRDLPKNNEAPKRKDFR